MSITTNIKAIRRYYAQGYRSRRGTHRRISQMVWMLFMKIFADKEEEWEITIDNYKSPIQEKI